MRQPALWDTTVSLKNHIPNISFAMLLEHFLCDDVSVNIKAKRFETNTAGEIEQIAINEPIKISVFTTHPASVKDESSILYYESSNIQKQDTVVKIIVKELPKYISIDPFGTRTDENLTNNLYDL